MVRLAYLDGELFMKTFHVCAIGVMVGALSSVALLSQAAGQGAVVYENARLILGDGTPPIEGGTLVVEAGKVTSVGAKGAVTVPGGATRVDLSGKTVMPTMNNAHIHIGYEGFTSWGAQNYSTANLVDHLQREAFYGVGVVHSAGDQPIDPSFEFQKKQEAGAFPGAARLIFSAGMAPPGGGPDIILIRATDALKVVFEITTPAEARAAVQKIAAKKVNALKIWVDNRDAQRGAKQKMPPEVYTAIIDEAHKNGILVHAHATNLADQKAVVKAGVDVLVHTVAGEKIDDEFLAILKDKKPFWNPVMGLSDPPEVCNDENQFVQQALPEKAIADIRNGVNGFNMPGCDGPDRPGRIENLMYNVPRMVAAGARLALSTDAGVIPKYTYGSSEHHELELYVKLGITPAQAIVAATRTSAEVMRITDTGTLASGKRADFLVLDANPLDNIRNTRRINAVYLGGAKVDRAKLLATFKNPPAAAPAKR
jgi:imidazolonepropionase-like amidohydrolase